MIPHLQQRHVAEIGYMNDNEAKLQIKCAKITVIFTKQSIGNDQ